MPLPGNRAYPLKVVGESFNVANLRELHGRATDEMRVSQWTATLVLDDDNRYDPGNAVRVEIRGRQVGHLSREDAAQFRKVCGRARSLDCDAIIIALRGDAAADYGVRLDLQIWPADERFAD